MSKQILSKFKIYKVSGLNALIDESWVDWAIEMIEAGYATNNLYELAGITRPYDQVALRHLTDKILIDLELDFRDKATSIRNYAGYIISKTIDKPDKCLETLDELKDIYRELGYEEEYSSFYFLHFAKDDLIHYEEQFYWMGADKKNIDSIIKEQFQNFINKIDCKIV